MAKLFYHLIQKYGRKRTLEYLKLVGSAICTTIWKTDKRHGQVSQISNSQNPASPAIDWTSIQLAYDNFIEHVIQDDSDSVHPDLSAIVQESSAPIDKIKGYTERLGCMHTASSGGHAFFNGKHINVNDVSCFLEGINSNH